jgi:hypothetical protein
MNSVFQKKLSYFEWIKDVSPPWPGRLRQAMTPSRQSPIWASNVVHSKLERKVLMITILLYSINSILHRMLQATSLNVWWNYNARQEVLQFPILWMCYLSQPSRFRPDSQWDCFLMSPITNFKLYALLSQAKLEISNSSSHHSSSCPQREYSLLLGNMNLQNMLSSITRPKKGEVSRMGKIM